MGIAHYIKEIGRGKDGARPLTREQAKDLFGQVLDWTVTDLEVGGFCLAMRIKGETAQEMAGFLDAAHERLSKPLVPEGRTAIILPSYNGARKLPLLTPLLALLLAREGLPVLIHGTQTESTRISVNDVLTELAALGEKNIVVGASDSLEAGKVTFIATEALCPGLKRLLDVRRAVGLRNPAHSLVKLMSPVRGNSIVVGSYTHPEYAISMAATFALTRTSAMLLRGTEGEGVADPRRTPQMQGFIGGVATVLQEFQPGTLASVPDLPTAIDAKTTAQYIRRVLQGEAALPSSIRAQVEHLIQLAQLSVQPRNLQAAEQPATQAS